jgi:hypothetical protein
MMRRVETSKANLVAFKFVRVWMPSEKEKDEGVIGESGRLASRSAAILNEPDNISTSVRRTLETAMTRYRLDPVFDRTARADKTTVEIDVISDDALDRAVRRPWRVAHGLNLLG